MGQLLSHEYVDPAVNLDAMPWRTKCSLSSVVLSQSPRMSLSHMRPVMEASQATPQLVKVVIRSPPHPQSTGLPLLRLQSSLHLLPRGPPLRLALPKCRASLQL